jgi:hypothetical protein
LEEHYLLVLAHTGSCARPSPSPRLRSFRCTRGPRRLSPDPAGRWPFPTLSLQSVRRRSDPYPAAFLGCSCPFLLRGHRPRATGNALGTRDYPCNATSTGSVFSRLQSFVDLQAPTLARPPGCTHRGTTGAGQPGRLHHASPGWLLIPGCGIATCPTWAIDTAGLSPAGLQPCRLLLPALRLPRRRHHTGFMIPSGWEPTFARSRGRTR